MSLINNKIDFIANEIYEGNNSKFARDFDTSDVSIRRYRNDKTPNFDFIMKLVNKLNISWQWLIEDKGEMQSTANQQLNEPPPAYNQNELIEVQRKLIATNEEKISQLKKELTKAKEEAVYFKKIAEQKKKFENTR